MAVLSTQSRDRTWFQAMRDFGFDAVLKSEGRAAIDAADDWIEANFASYNSALPAAFRTKATAAQKAIILAVVLWRRIGRLIAREDG